MRVARLLVAAVAVTLVLTACSASAPPPPPDAPSGDALADLPRERLSQTSPVRLADDVVPPTNRWYSSLVFSPEPLPVYPFPIAVAPRLDGFAIQAPAVTSSATSVSAGFTGGLSLSLGASGFTVVRADPVSVTLAYADDAGAVADVTLAEGSPVVGVVAHRDLAIALPVSPTVIAEGAWTATDASGTYLLDTDAGALRGRDLHVEAGGVLQVAALPRDADAAAWAAALQGPVSAVETAFEVGGDAVTTRLTYLGTDSTVVVPFPGHEATTRCTLGTFETPYGPAPACAGTVVEWSAARVEPASAYDLSGTDEASLAAIAAQAGADLDATPATPADTYFGGKALARIATLVTLARASDDAELAERAVARLEDELRPWLAVGPCRERCFVYDDERRLVVGKATGFGSEDGNDHHFHYGYFLYAAAVLSEERPDLVDALAPVMDALAADIALGAGDALPTWRVFDPYRGHSWAAGASPFADGNNQESSSEAVAAWNGLALWAAARGDAVARDTALWLLAGEAAAARTLWLEPDLSALPDAYAHSIVSISWSAKRDYATWFSAEPSAILGIQLLPLGPVSLAAMDADADRVARNVTDTGDAAVTGPLGDYVLAYSALAGPDALASATERISAMPADAFDDGWSKAAALAFLAAAASAG